MKSLSLALLLALPLAVHAGDTLKRYKIKSGHIEYAVSGSQTGTETLRWNNWGHREVRETHTAGKVMGIPQKMNSKTFLHGVWQYQLDLDRNQGTKMKNPMLEDMQKNGTDPQKFGEEMMKSMGGQKTGTDTVLGRKCEVWEVASVGSKTCIWNGVPLKVEVNTFGLVNYNTVATSFNEKAKIPDSQLAVPDGVAFRETTMPHPGQAGAQQGGEQPKMPDLKKMFKGFGKRDKN